MIYMIYMISYIADAIYLYLYMYIYIYTYIYIYIDIYIYVNYVSPPVHPSA